MKTMLIAGVCETSDMQALIVKQDMPLAEAVRQFATNHVLRGLFLVDAQEQLVGVVNKRDLLRWVSMQLDEVPSGEPLSVGEMRRLVNAQSVFDLAVDGSANAAVRLDQTIADALQRMTQYQLVDIPVIGADGRVVNDLRLSEILAYTLASES